MSTNTVEERRVMIDKLQECGYHLTYIVYIIDEVVNFDKETRGLTHQQKFDKIKNHRWLSKFRDIDVKHLFPSINNEEVIA